MINFAGALVSKTEQSFVLGFFTALTIFGLMYLSYKSVPLSSVNSKKRISVVLLLSFFTIAVLLIYLKIVSDSVY
jgi:hypothetical protein